MKRFYKEVTVGEADNGWRVQLDVLNLFNARANQITYAYGSLLRTDPLYGLCYPVLAAPAEEQPGQAHGNAAPGRRAGRQGHRRLRAVRHGAGLLHRCTRGHQPQHPALTGPAFGEGGEGGDAGVAVSSGIIQLQPFFFGEL